MTLLKRLNIIPDITILAANTTRNAKINEVKGQIFALLT